jgi:hypothetical protein
MPLNPDREDRSAGDLQTLDRPVGGPRGGDQPVPEPVHGLVMVGRRVQPGLVAGAREHPAQRPGRSHPDQVPPESAVRPGVLFVPHDLRQVLVQRPAADHVEQLNAPADGQQRPAGRQRRVQQGQLPAVSLAVRRAGLRVGHRAVPGRIHVPAARHDQPVQVGHGGRGFGRVAARRQQHRPPAAAPHRIHVGLRDQRGRNRPVAPLGQVVVRGNTDQRAHVHLGHFIQNQKTCPAPGAAAPARVSPGRWARPGSGGAASRSSG